MLDRASEILTLIQGRALPLRPPESRGASRGSRGSALGRTVVQQLCALDVENEAEAKAFLSFVAHQGRELNLGLAGA